MNKQELKQRVIETIEANKKDIIALADEIYANPEYGFKEFNTSRLIQDFFSRFNLPIEKDLAITGCAIHTQAKNMGPKILVMGELDAISSINHKDALPSGAVHACGHNHQVAGMLGAAVGIIQSNILDFLSGQISFLGVPAEEYIEMEERMQMRKEGKIKYLSGKQHLIAEGFFDDVDMVIMFHSLDCGSQKALIKLNCTGFIGKKIVFKGKEAHAGGAPDKGINALNAAVLAMNNIHAQRETFRDEDWIRIHPIITKGGDLTNVVPADVRMESYIRGTSLEAVKKANKKFDRAIKAGAMAVGGAVEITDIPGYLPVLHEETMLSLFKENLLILGIKEEEIRPQADVKASFDFGDITHLIPAIHPFMGGITGDLHAANYTVIDKDLAYILPAKAMAMTIIDLLYDDAQEAKKIIQNYKPLMTKEEYIDFLNDMDKSVSYPYWEE